ncbi:MAG: hypothetical protein KGP14_06870 [Betaproteobacteria bacterium]|nr:hypothetical protein [Betaproteobacteria bacterium]
MFQRKFPSEEKNGKNHVSKEISLSSEGKKNPYFEGNFPFCIPPTGAGKIGKKKPLYYVKGKRPSGVGLLPLHYVPRISLSIVRNFRLSQIRSIITSKGGVLRCQPKLSTTSGQTAGTTEGRKDNSMQHLDPLKSLNLQSPDELLQPQAAPRREIPVITADTLDCPACEAGGCMVGGVKPKEEDP